MPEKPRSVVLNFRPLHALLSMATIVALLSLCTSAHVAAQSRGSDGRARNPGLTGWCETLATERHEDVGCYTTAIHELGALPRGPIYWHLDTFPTRAAADANATPTSTVVTSLGRTWLFTIAAQQWRPAAGERVAQIGPLSIDPDQPYTARYLESVIPAGFQQGAGVGHQHPGPEAWYVLAGGQCLETPKGVQTARAGETMVAPEGWPMAIVGLGTETRRTVFLVLHRSGEPFSGPVDARPDAAHAHWTPQGLCPK